MGIKKLLCKLGIHLMKDHKENFRDIVSGGMVYDAKCSCGKTWMVDTLFPIAFSKVEK